MWRRSATTRLIVDASRMLHEMVGMLYEPEHGAAMRTDGTDAGRVASWRMRTATSRTEFVRFPSSLVVDTKSSMASSGQG